MALRSALGIARAFRQAATTALRLRDASRALVPFCAKATDPCASVVEQHRREVALFVVCCTTLFGMLYQQKLCKYIYIYVNAIEHQ